jgi:hypothetical protein
MVGQGDGCCNFRKSASALLKIRKRTGHVKEMNNLNQREQIVAVSSSQIAPAYQSRDRAGEFALDLDGGKRLVFESANDPVPVNEDDSIDWSKVTSIRIVFIGDYHD